MRAYYLNAEYLNRTNEGAEKLGGNETYYMVDKNSSRQVRREVVRSTYIPNEDGTASNHHQFTLQVLDLGAKFIHIFASVGQGYYVRYHKNTAFRDQPFFERIENFLPVRLEDDPIRYWDKYAANYTFIAEFNDGVFWPDQQNYTFQIRIAEYAYAFVYLNDSLILEVPYQHCHDQYYKGTKEVWSDVTNSTEKSETDYSSCCAQSYSHTREISGN